MPSTFVAVLIADERVADVRGQERVLRRRWRR